jgi:hypothetical protein
MNLIRDIKRMTPGMAALAMFPIVFYGGMFLACAWALLDHWLG